MGSVLMLWNEAASLNHLFMYWNCSETSLELFWNCSESSFEKYVQVKW